MKGTVRTDDHRSGWLLSELEVLAADKLSDEAQQRLRRKVASKLDSAIHSRMKDGMSYEQAELDAVASFGTPEDFLERYLEARQQYYGTVNRRSTVLEETARNGPTDEAWIALLWLLGIGISGWLFFAEGVGVISIFEFIGGLLLLPVAIIKSRSKKELGGIYVALGGLACLLLALGVLMASSNTVG